MKATFGRSPKLAPGPGRGLASYEGFLSIAAAAFFWGVSATLGRAAFTGRLRPGSDIARIDPLLLSQARTTFSCIVVAVGFIARRGFRPLALPARDLWRLFWLGLAGVAASNYLYYLAIQRTNVATAIIVQYTAPIWVLVYMCMRGAERASGTKIGSVLLALAGLALVVGIFQKGVRPDGLGFLAALLAAFSFAYYNIAGHLLLVEYDRWTVLLYTTLAASLFWLVANPPAKIISAHYSAAAWLFLVVFSWV